MPLFLQSSSKQSLQMQVTFLSHGSSQYNNLSLYLAYIVWLISWLNTCGLYLWSFYINASSLLLIVQLSNKRCLCIGENVPILCPLKIASKYLTMVHPYLYHPLQVSYKVQPYWYYPYSFAGYPLFKSMPKILLSLQWAGPDITGLMIDS